MSITLRTVAVKLVYSSTRIGVQAGGTRGLQSPPNFGLNRFFGQQEKIWAKPVFKDISMLFYHFEEINISILT